MHVVWAPSWYPTPDQPLNGSFFAEQVQMLGEAGVKVGVIALDPHSFWQGKPGEIQQSERVFRRSVPVLPKGVFPGDQALINAYAKPLAKAYEAEFGRPDLVHAHSVFPGVLLANFLAKFWDTPFGITEHRPSSLERSRLTPRFHAINKAVSRTSFRLTVSDGMALRASEFYGKEFSTIPLPVVEGFEHIEPDLKASEEFVFAHLSMLDRNKRPEETIQAFAKVHAENPSTRLVIGGGNPERVAELQETAKKLGVSDSVSCVGKVDRLDVPKFMANSDCHILFSAQEAGGVVFSEAHATGTPSITSATDGGKFHVTPELGYVVPVDDVPALAQAMSDIIKAKKDGLFSRQEVRSLSLSRVGKTAYVDRTLRTYKRVIANR